MGTATAVGETGSSSSIATTGSTTPLVAPFFARAGSIAEDT